MTDIFDFIKEMRLLIQFTSKQMRFIDNIYFYINDLIIYKYVVAVNPRLLKKAKRYGLNSEYIIHINDFEHKKIKEPLENTKKGRFILMYNPGLNEITIAQGEDYCIKKYGLI